MTEPNSIQTERLLLKPTSEDDAEFILALMNMPKWIQNIGDRNVRTVADAREYIKSKMLPQLERLGYSNYTVIRKADKTKIGTCGLFDRAEMEGVDIGFAFLPEYEKQGYAYELALKLKTLAFSVFELSEINAITIKENKSSQKLLEKLGLKCIGTTRLANDTVELLLYNVKR